MSLWGYKDAHGRIVATCQNDMSGNTGWEEVNEDTKPEESAEAQGQPNLSTEQRIADLESQNADIMDGLIEVANLAAGGE